MAQPFLGQILIAGFNFAPKGYAFCDGQLLAINQNQALFAILGTTYGGNGTTTFALPDLRSRTPVHVGAGINLGQVGGSEAVTLITSQLAAHNHTPSGTATAASVGTPVNNTWAPKAGNTPFSNAAPDTAMGASAIANTGGSQPHTNLQPYLVINFCIALQGIFPSRN